MKKAGAVIGEGEDGFVIDPPIPCADGRDMRGYVTRIRKFEDEIYQVNADVLAKLREIDPDQKYFYYPLECTPGNLTEQNKKDGVTEQNKSRSELLRKATSETWTNAKYRPRTWTEWAKGRNKLVLESTASRSNPQKNHLINAVKLLHQHNIVHNDLHGNNVLMADDGLPRIIDFELARIVDRDDPEQEAVFYLNLDRSRLKSLIEGKLVTTSKSKGGRRKTQRRKKTRRHKLKH